MKSTTKNPKIFSKIAAIMAEIGAIGKDQKNTGQNYNFRGIDQAQAALQPLLIKHGVILCPQYTDVKFEELKRGVRCTLTLALGWVSVDDGSNFTTILPGEGVDYGDKACAKAQSCAFKYAVWQTLCVPTEEKVDAEYENPVQPNPAEVKRLTGLMQAAKSTGALRTLVTDVEGLTDEDKDALRKVYNECVEKLG